MAIASGHPPSLSLSFSLLLRIQSLIFFLPLSLCPLLSTCRSLSSLPESKTVPATATEQRDWRANIVFVVFFLAIGNLKNFSRQRTLVFVFESESVSWQTQITTVYERVSRVEIGTKTRIRHEGGQFLEEKVVLRRRILDKKGKKAAADFFFQSVVSISFSRSFR